MPGTGVRSNDVFRSLLEAVLSGRYAPGEKLPPQRALAADLDVTMGTLREALKRLEQMGLIAVRHGDAMRVRDWREHGGLDVVAHLALGSTRSGESGSSVLADVFEARGLMLQEIAALAATRRSEAHARRLGELAALLAQSGTAASAQRLDFAFFTEVAEAAGNLVFVLILNSIRELYFAHAERLPVTARPAELAPLYEHAAAAIGARRPAAARHAVAALAQRQRERVEEGSG